MPETPTPYEKLVHELGNYVGIIVGFTDLVLEAMPQDDPAHADMIEVRQAAEAAAAIVHQLSEIRK